MCRNIWHGGALRELQRKYIDQLILSRAKTKSLAVLRHFVRVFVWTGHPARRDLTHLAWGDLRPETSRWKPLSEVQGLWYP